MAAQNSIQGSLFGEPVEESSQKSSWKGKTNSPSEEISNEELQLDALNRPRESKKSKNSLNWQINGFESQDANQKENDWSHHSLVNIDELTPVLRHYVELKKNDPERILLYRLGDFFECFFEDAIKLSKNLEITLTGKEAGKKIGRVPMAGIPHHAAEKYCAELVQKGFSITICDQLENALNKSSSHIKRGITRIITPGTIIEEGMLQARKNNWLSAVLIEKSVNETNLLWAIASVDVSTGEFIVQEGNNNESLFQELMKTEASEIICAETKGKENFQWCPKNINLTEVEKTPFSTLEAESSLKKHYKLSTLNGLGLHEYPRALRVSGGLVNYINQTNPSFEDNAEEKHIPLEPPKILSNNEVLIIDAQTRRNLEITCTQRDGQFQGSLLWAIDRTLTSMGGRCLRRWLEAPLTNKSQIISRQNIVTKLVQASSLKNDIRKSLRSMGDLERLAGRAGAGHASGRDLAAISDGLLRLPSLSKLIKNISNNSPKWLISIQQINPKLIKIGEKIDNYLIDNQPLGLTEGGIINDGIDSLLDGLRNQLDDQDDWLKNQEILERKRSNINNLKIQYHRTFGYFLSVTKSKANSVPDHWIRRQTLANEERFITPDLKAREGKIFQLKARAAQREYEIFCELRLEVGKHAFEIRKAAKAIAGIDCLASLAEIAATNSYSMPEILEANKNDTKINNISKCRHPVVEQILSEKKFQPNNINIGQTFDLIVLTGPNASGKSCYLRQIGLVQLLAQIGSWIPAEKASITIADRIFTRVGAVDDLSAGQSTFIVEMSETAFILNQATEHSIVLLDEIGRGTSTFDGLSIAWAVSEYLAKTIRSRTIFATHYHELNQLSKTLSNVKNFQVLVEETGDELIFLHEVIPGGSNKSYGIEAARLAGVPIKVVNRAKSILENLQKNGSMK